MIALELFILACSIAFGMYSWAWTFRIWMWGHLKLRARAVCWELRPFMFVAIPACTFNYLATTHDGPFWRVYTLVIYAGYMIAAILDKGDDRWKKRRKRLAAKVKEVAGRLVVVPIPVPVPVGA